MNAKARRLQKRAELRGERVPRGLVRSGGDDDDATSGDAASTNVAKAGNAKERRRAKREEARRDAAAAAAKKRARPERDDDHQEEEQQQQQRDEDDAPKKKKKKKPSSKEMKQTAPLVAFVGQLSYETSGERLRDFLKSRGVAARVRLLTAEDGRSRGMAFVECESAEALHACVALHHSQLDGRRINVEKSAGGGKSRRQTRIQDTRQKQRKIVETTVERVLEEYLADGRLRPEDVDDGVRRLLARRSGKLAAKALDEYCAVEDRHALDNPPAYLTAIVTRLSAEEDDRQDEKLESDGTTTTGRQRPREVDDGASAKHQKKTEVPSKNVEPHQQTAELANQPTKKTTSQQRPRRTTNDHDLAAIFPALRARR